MTFPFPIRPPIASAASYTTWNSADKAAEITLSGSDLVATHSTSTNYGGVRTVASKTTGKFYWEVTYTTGGTEDYIGVAKAGASLAAYLGSDTNGWGFYMQSNDVYYSAGLAFSGSGSVSAASVIMFATDHDAGKLWVGVGGSWRNSGDPAAGTGHVNSASLFAGIAIYPCFISKGATAGAATANFGASAFSHSVPSGFTSGFTA